MTNAVMASVPGHPLWTRVQRMMAERAAAGEAWVIAATGDGSWRGWVLGRTSGLWGYGDVGKSCFATDNSSRAPCLLLTHRRLVLAGPQVVRDSVVELGIVNGSFPGDHQWQGTVVRVSSLCCRCAAAVQAQLSGRIKAGHGSCAELPPLSVCDA